MFQDQDGEKVFPFPLFTTCVHMIVQFGLASLVLYCVPRLRPSHSSYDSHMIHSTNERSYHTDPTKPIMTKWFYFTSIGPCGIATGLDIGLGNFSLKFITLTFYSKPEFLTGELND
jgi:solute carrier family 35 protein C2